MVVGRGGWTYDSLGRVSLASPGVVSEGKGGGGGAGWNGGLGGPGGGMYGWAMVAGVWREQVWDVWSRRAPLLTTVGCCYIGGGLQQVVGTRSGGFSVSLITPPTIFALFY